MGGERDGRAGEHDQGSRTARKWQIKSCVADSALRTARELAHVQAQHQRKLFRKNESTEQFAYRRDTYTADSVEVVKVRFFAAAEIVGKCDAGSIVIATQNVVSDAIAGADEGNIPISNIDDRASLHVICARTVIVR